MNDHHQAISETKNVLIPMPDGIHLAANLVRPDEVGPLPAIVVYFPYLKDLHGSSPIADWQRHFARRGYACLTVDMRGTGASGGIMAPFFSPSEREDAAAMLAWIAAQPWCNGQAGMWGISYSGSSALAAASMRPPSLRAIVPMHGTANEYLGFLWPHGCRPAWWTEASWGPMMTLLALLPPLHRDPERRWATIWHERLERLAPPPFLWHTIPFDTYQGWRTDPAAVQAATYAVSAWHDYYARATLDYFAAIPAPKRVIIGPWKHELPDLAVTGAIDHVREMDRWWDRWLKEDSSAEENSPPVMIWHQGANRWGYEEEWPPRQNQMRLLYADANGQLGPTAPTTDERDHYTVDPTVGLHLLPWDPQAPVVAMPYDRSSDDHRSLTYTTAPLDAPLDIVGNPVATIALTADAPDFPLHVCLCDVAPSGLSTLICQGWVRAAHAAGEPLKVGRIYELAVPLYSTSYQVALGRRLRIAIAGANFPLLWPSSRNPTLSVFRSPTHATRLLLPITRPSEPPLTEPRFALPAIALANPPTNERWLNQISRDLIGQTASFEQTSEASYRLDDGVLLHLREHTVSTINASHPADTVLTAHLTARLARAVDPIVVTVDAIETADHYHFEGRIEMAGRPFYSRSWDLRLPPDH